MAWRVGCISDVQYADHDDEKTKYGGIWRYYRHTLPHFKNSLTVFEEQNVECVLQLGDFIDGRSKHDGVALDRFLDLIKKSQLKFHHAIGNHDLYYKQGQPHIDLVSKLMPEHNCTYYSFSPQPGFRFICLDSYDISVLGRNETDSTYKLAEEILAVNPNKDRNSPTGLEGADGRFVAYNGAVGNEQLEWLEKSIREAEQVNEQIIVFGHIPICTQVTRYQDLLWNYKEVSQILENSTNVLLYLSGHTHSYKHYIQNGVHHLTMPGIIEAPPNGAAWSLLNFHSDHLQVKVIDNQASHEVIILYKNTLLEQLS